MGMFGFLFGFNKKKKRKSLGFFSLFEGQGKENKRKQLEREMENYGLEKWQKKLVRNGKYDITSFEILCD